MGRTVPSPLTIHTSAALQEASFLGEKGGGRSGILSSPDTSDLCQTAGFSKRTRNLQTGRFPSSLKCQKKRGGAQWRAEQKKCVHRVLRSMMRTHKASNYACHGSMGRLLLCRGQRRCSFDPWVGTIPWRRKWQPPPVFLPGESHGQRSLAGYSL